jgi:hypothetical protein
LAGLVLAAAPPADPSDVQTSPHPLAALQKNAAPAGGSAAEQAAQPSLIPKYATGFMLLTGSGQSVPVSSPKNRLDYSISGAAGFGVLGTPFDKWSYLAYVIGSVSADAVNGVGGSVAPEQITVKYAPFPWLWFQAGYMRIPFVIVESVDITQVMFPARPQAAEVFQTGADAGLLAAYEHPAGYLRVRLGIFDGLSLGLTTPGYTVHGEVLMAAVEVAPFGTLPAIEGDFKISPFHLSLGGSVMYRNGTEFDTTGYEGLHFIDSRVAGTLRLSVRGFYFQAEYLQDVQTDSLTDRPRVARGTYGEGSYYVPIKKKIGLAPVTRVGWSVTSEGFFPLHVVQFDAGLAFYPRGDLSSPGALRIVAEYLSERQVESQETAYGGLVSGMLRF